MGLFDALFGRRGPRPYPEVPPVLQPKAWWRITALMHRLGAGGDTAQLLAAVFSKYYRGKNALAFAVLAKSLMDKANTPELHTACRLLLGHNDADTFRGFRLWLLCQPQEVYEAALKSADTLADLPADTVPNAAEGWLALLATLQDYYGQPLPHRYHPVDYRQSSLSEEQIATRLPRLLERTRQA